MTGKKKFYVVWEGHNPGIYESWSACQQQIQGYSGAKYKSFSRKEEAEAAFYQPYADFVGKGTFSSLDKRPGGPPADAPIVWDSLSVDAACSGNPGAMEYQGVHTQTGAQVFHQKFELGTNNIGEFLAIVHGLAQLKREGKQETAIYSDSKIAMGWVIKKSCRTKLPHSPKTERLFQLIERAELWLLQNTYSNPVLKWETEEWGEIPADFGRKK